MNLEMVFFKKRGKEGSSHLEMVLAFSLFIVFTIWLLYSLRPPEEATVSNIILDELVDSFKNYTSTELITLVVKPDSTNCTNFSLPGLEGNSFVRDFNGEQYRSLIGGWTLVSTGILNSSFSGGILIINSTTVEPIQVFISKEFVAGTATCANASAPLIGGINRKQVISSTNFSAFKNEYDVNYSDLKTKLHIPSDVEFAVNATGFVEAEKEHPKGVDVKSKVAILDVIFPNGDVKKMEVYFKIWK